MKELQLAGWRVEADAERTALTYATIAEGGWKRCGCASCRNFGAVVPGAFPAAVRTFFRQAGIDPFKDAEVYDLGRARAGRVRYDGEYYFWGSIVHPAHLVAIVGPRCRVAFHGRGQLAPPEFAGEGAICLAFSADLPWILADEAP
jgi:hypothetical protein